MKDESPVYPPRLLQHDVPIQTPDQGWPALPLATPFNPIRKEHSSPPPPSLLQHPPMPHGAPYRSIVGNCASTEA